MEVLTGKWVLVIDRIGLEDVVAVDGIRFLSSRRALSGAS